LIVLQKISAFQLNMDAYQKKVRNVVDEVLRNVLPLQHIPETLSEEIAQALFTCASPGEISSSGACGTGNFSGVLALMSFSARIDFSFSFFRWN